MYIIIYISIIQLSILFFEKSTVPTNQKDQPTKLMRLVSPDPHQADKAIHMEEGKHRGISPRSQNLRLGGVFRPFFLPQKKTV